MNDTDTSGIVVRPSLEDFFEAFEATQGFRPYPGQMEAITSNSPATWVLAGPGTGKTEVLVLRALRLMIVEGVPPESIVLTTFTNRAAAELRERIELRTDKILEQPSMSGVERPNTSGMWLGTIHSIAYDILRNFDADSDRLVMLDEQASTFRILQHSSGDLIDPAMYETLNGSEPQRWVYYDRIHHAERLKAAINRIIEDDLDRERLDANEPDRSEQSTWPNEQIREKFLDLSQSYEERLGGAVDFSGVQATFLDFLEGPSAASFLESDEERGWQGIRHVIVDEYQDTNPVQEAIYMAMCRFGASITVVGDDDQALYRFRGASVDAMIGFDQRCSTDHPAIESDYEVLTVTLDENRRSHEGIVGAVNNYVRGAERSIRYDLARTAKPDLKAKALVEGSHDSFFVIVRDDEAKLGAAVADIIQDLVMEGDIADMRDVALLAGSTKETSRSPFRHYANAFENRDIPLFNPGSKTLHRDPWMMEAMGVICHIVDPHEDVLGVQGKKITSYVRSLKKLARKLLASDEEFREQIDSITSRFDQPARDPNEEEPDSYPGSWNVLKLFYEILNTPAFSHLIDSSGGPHESASSWRMGWITQLIRSFQMAQILDGWMPHSTHADEEYYRWRGRDPPMEIRGISPQVVDRIYRDLLALLSSGGFNEIEDEIVKLPPGAVPALTIHQSKGLEFPIVFVCANRPSWGPGAEHHQEDLFHPYRKRAMFTHGEFSTEKRAMHDDVRKLFVAMSRAQYACGICLTSDTYEGIIRGEKTVVEAYPHLPAEWLRGLLRR